ncbi:uncharacterized protein CLUP02_11663 [Colletotrichum lupini]|uniref:Uncharacterized protein n=1 Tax=Colletotrichum lupini TaxID=145971 RepID=A0A9Q8SZN6_9PEZI|nr:uncharacterized protein CLUP02_11663 [Colletotrichum lupini]UQC86163.1 hypothetical protein CLUP02_11663 [Colletotrichum lupini]
MQRRKEVLRYSSSFFLISSRSSYCIESGSSAVSVLFSGIFQLLFKILELRLKTTFQPDPISSKTVLIVSATFKISWCHRPLPFNKTDPLGFVASVYGIIFSLSEAQNAFRIALSRSFENVGAQESLRRSAASMTMLKFVYVDFGPKDLYYRIEAEPAAHKLELTEEFHLAQLNKSLTCPSDNRLRKNYFNHVAGTPETVMQRLRDIEQTLILRRIERLVVRSEQLHLKREAESNKTQQAVAEIDQALSLYKSHMLAKISSLSTDLKALDGTESFLYSSYQSKGPRM